MADSYSSSSSMLSLSAEIAVQKIRLNILSRARPHPWLDQFIQENQHCISEIIDKFTFGESSEFTKNYPAPNPVDQVKLLKAFLEKKQNVTLESDVPYNIHSLTKKLGAYTKDKVVLEQASFIIELCFKKQVKGEESWLINLANLGSLAEQLKALHTIQILNKMESILENSKEKSHAKLDLEYWVNNLRTQIANDAAYKRKFRLPSRILLFIGNEIKDWVMALKVIKRTIVSISRSTASQLLNKDHLAKIIFGVLRLISKVIGLALLPCRFTAVILSELGEQYSKALLHSIYKMIPRRYLDRHQLHTIVKGAIWGGRIGLGIAAYFFIPSAILFTALGGPVLSAFLSLSLIPTIAVGFCLGESGLGIALGFARKAFKKPAPIAPIQQDNEVGTALNSEQREALCILLTGKSVSLENDYWREPSVLKKKALKQDEIEIELLKLYQSEIPYYLSNFDKKLLTKRGDLPESFISLETEIHAGLNKP